MYGQVDDLVSVTQDHLRISSKNKRKKPPDTSVIRKEPIGESFNPKKNSKEDTVTDVENFTLLKTPPSFRHKVY